ncbi:phytanoyl-CoA dioxygenase, partial [Porticoccaceae bacterium]|nr:phytanoyl-CoA dioxygenase [Porticoccaceae bacterium]
MKQDISESIAACAAHYGDDAEAMRSYLTQGERNAYALDNRGAIRFDKRGNLAADILSAYSKYGFYIFENVLAEDELQDIKEDLDQIRASYPA